MTEFQNELKIWMADYNATLADLARKSDCSESTLRRRLKKNPHPDGDSFRVLRGVKLRRRDDARLLALRREGETIAELGLGGGQFDAVFQPSGVKIPPEDFQAIQMRGWLTPVGDGLFEGMTQSWEWADAA